MGSHSAMQHQNQHPDVSVFIKNLNEMTDDKTLNEIFAEFGTIVSCKLAYDEKGRSKGYAFVQYECVEAARTAIEKVNGMLIDDKSIYVGKFIPRKGRNKERDEKNLYTNLYVKNFGNDFTEDQLRQLFEPFGKIKSHKIMTNMEGHSKGFGFVAFERAEFAEEALRKLNGKALGSGHKLYVARAQKKAERQQELQRQFEEQEERKRRANSHGLNLYVKNLDDGITDEHLRREFSLYGPITSARVMTDSSGRSKGFGFVRFVSPVDACFAAAGLNGRMFGLKPLYVSLAQRREERRALLVAQHMRQRLQATESLYATSKNSYCRPRAVPSHQRLHVPSAMPPHSSRSQVRLSPSSHWPASTIYNGSESSSQNNDKQTWRNSSLTRQPQTQRMGTAKSQCSLRHMSPMTQPLLPTTSNQSQHQIPIQTHNHNHNQNQNPSQSQGHALKSPTPSQLLPIALPKPATPSHVHVQVQVPMPVQVQVHPIASTGMLSVQQYNSYISIPSSTASESVAARSSQPNVSAMANTDMQDDKQVIGEHIYYIVEKIYPQLSGKITGMLLEMDNSDLWYLLNDAEALRDKIEEAYQVYKDYVNEMRGPNKTVDTD